MKHYCRRWWRGGGRRGRGGRPRRVWRGGGRSGGCSRTWAAPPPARRVGGRGTLSFYKKLRIKIGSQIFIVRLLFSPRSPAGPCVVLVAAPLPLLPHGVCVPGPEEGGLPGQPEGARPAASRPRPALHTACQAARKGDHDIIYLCVKEEGGYNLDVCPSESTLHVYQSDYHASQKSNLTRHLVAVFIS